MRAPISIIIPTLNAAPNLGPLLASLGEGLAAGLITEVIFSDGGSTDGIDQVADIAGAVLINGPPGRGVQLAAGAKIAKGRWLLFLHADSELAEGWVEVVQRHLEQGQAPAYFRLVFDAQGLAPRIVAGWANLRSQIFNLPYGDQGLLISGPDYDAVGGYPELPLMEDVAMARALGNLQGIDVAIHTSAVRYQKQGWVRRGARNLWTLARYFAGVDPEKLARAYRR